MKTASITEAKNNLSALIDGLRRGPVLILDRGRPVARLQAVAEHMDHRFAELVRAGLTRPAEAPLTQQFLNRPLPKLKPGYSAVAALLRERREGR